MLAIAQWERRQIAERTRHALAAAKAQGITLGRPSKVTPETRARILQERTDGATLRAIADGLNRDGVKTGHAGRQWWPSSVRAILRALERP